MSLRRTAAATSITLVAALAVTMSGTGQDALASAAPHGVKSVGRAKTVRSALGGGLGRLVAQNGGATPRSSSPFQPTATAQFDAQGRVLVSLTPQAGVDHGRFLQQARAAGLVLHNTGAHGTVYGFVAVSGVARLAAIPGTGSLSQVNRPVTAAGSVSDFGVQFQNAIKAHRRGYTGRGLTVGVISDSFDGATVDAAGNPLTIHAAQDVASGDLPGPGNPDNSHPVVVIADYDGPAATDEGRGMAQIVHDMAPKAKLCFATAFFTEQDFADHIRQLADPSGPCRADVVVDDIGYFTEPMFGDGPVAKAVDDVTAQGVSYFSAAMNAGDHNSWRSPVNLVPEAQAVAGTNLDFSTVPPDLYDGGLQDMKPGPGVDPAQDSVFGAAPAIFNLQWDDPFDPNGATFGDPIFTGSGEITDADPAPSLTFTPTADELGQTVRFRVDGDPSGSVDLILTVTKPDGTTLGPIDTITSPESVITTLDQPGDYTITVEGFAGDTGPFTAEVTPVLTPSKVSTDFNALFFDMDGNYLGALADDNELSGLPQEESSLAGLGPAQLVISRSGTGPIGATTLSVMNYGRAYIDEYWDSFAPAIYGHPMAAGAIGVAAMDTFRPFLPEPYTSPGGSLPVYFDVNGNRYPRVQHRISPWIESVDGANTTFFTEDDPLDPDSLPNFFGTSAAAPHAAGIAALILQKHGGRGSVSPNRMKRILAHSTFKHDLDPEFSRGAVAGLRVTARGTQGLEGRPYQGTNADPNFFRVTYRGHRPVTSLTFYGDTASPTAKGRGIVFDTRPYTGTAPFFDQGFPFTVGSTAGGLTAGSISASFRGSGSGDSVAGQYRVMTIHFAHKLRRGQSFTFGIDRDIARLGDGTASEGNGADELGGAVLMPSGRVLDRGMQFRLDYRGRGHAVGEFRNRIGYGYTPVEGFGMLDARQAVLGR